MLKLLDSLAKELGTSRSRLNDGLVSAGLRDVIKSEVGIEAAGAAHLQQQAVTDSSRLAWQPVDHYIESGLGMKSLHRLGAVVREDMSPLSTHEIVEVDSRGQPGYGGSLYQKALRAIKRGVETGQVSAADVKSVLGHVSEFEKELVDFGKRLDEWEDNFKEVLRSQEEWRKAWDNTMTKHEKTINGEA
jgi:hypothetical protein